MIKENQLNLKDLKMVLATREIARFVVQTTRNKNYHKISFKNIEITSRSFLDELFVQSLKYKIELIEIPESLESLFQIIKRSHRDQKLYAPKIEVKIADSIFA